MIAFWPGLTGGFILDDYSSIIGSDAVKIESFSRDSLSAAADAYGGLIGRPVSTVSIALDHLRQGLDPTGFKNTNLVIHLINVLLLFVMTRRLLKVNAVHGYSVWPAWCALAITAAWALHPLQVSTVLYVVQRMEMLATLFTLLALLSYINAREHQLRGSAAGLPWLVLSTVMTALALLSKETGVLVFFYALTLELLFFRFRANSKLDRRLLLGLQIGFFAAALLAYLLVLLPAALAPETFLRREFSAGERLLTQFRALAYYLSLIVFPAPDRFLFFYDHYPHSTSLFKPLTTFFSALFLCFLATLAIILRKRHPLASLGIAWFFIGHLLSSNVFSLELVFEHRNYFPSFGIILTIAALLEMYGARLVSSGRLLAWLVICGLTLLTAIQAATWGDRINLAMHLASVNPKSERAQTELGAIYAGMSDGIPGSPLYQSAVIRLERAAALPAASSTPEQMLIILAARSNAQGKEAWWDSLVDKLTHRALGSSEQNAVSRLLENRTDGYSISDEGLARVEAVLRQRPETPPRLFANFGFYSLGTLNDAARGEKAFLEARRRLGDNQQALEEWIKELESGGFGTIADRLRGPEA